MSARSARSARGFTLIEVVVATSLLAMGLALAFGILRSSGRATARAELLAQREERLRAVQGFLRTQVNGALPIGYAFDPESGEASFFSVQPQKLELVASMPGYLSRGGPYLQTFELVGGPGGRQLRFQHQLLTPDGPLPAEREPLVLLEGIAEASFGAYMPADQSAAGGWGEWQSSAQLPPLVRLQVRFSDGRRWPEFVAAPRLGVPGVAGALPGRQALQ